MVHARPNRIAFLPEPIEIDSHATGVRAAALGCRQRGERIRSVPDSQTWWRAE